MNYQSHHSRRHDLLIILLSVVLLVVLAITYLNIRRQISTRAFRGIRGTVIDVKGNTITIRNIGKDNIISQDDAPKTALITGDTVINVLMNDGEFEINKSYSFNIGDFVSIQENQVDSRGFQIANVIDAIPVIQQLPLGGVQ